MHFHTHNIINKFLNNLNKFADFIYAYAYKYIMYYTEV